MTRRRRGTGGRRPRADREDLSRYRERGPRARVNTRATIGHRDDEEAMLARLRPRGVVRTRVCIGRGLVGGHQRAWLVLLVRGGEVRTAYARSCWVPPECAAARPRLMPAVGPREW